MEDHHFIFPRARLGYRLQRYIVREIATKINRQIMKYTPVKHKIVQSKH